MAKIVNVKRPNFLETTYLLKAIKASQLVSQVHITCMLNLKTK